MSTEQDKYKNTSTAAGSLVRPPTKFHDSISADPEAKFPAESGRYRLYVSFACPWAHRTLIVRNLKGLQDAISVTATDYTLPNLSLTPNAGAEYKGWEFITKNKANTKDTPGNVFYEPHGFSVIAELYEHAHPGYKQEFLDNGKRPIYSVPVLFDEKTQTIVSTESSEIIVMLNSEFNALAQNPDLDLNPTELREEMEAVNAIVYPSINDGVYRCGFAGTQEAYADAYKAHWEGMDRIEAILGKSHFLTGDRFTLSDIRLFVTLIRYDVVYYAHFKTSRNLVKEMPNMLQFLKRIYAMTGIKETVNIEFIVKHYYGSHKMLNPTGIWPLGPLRPDALAYLEE